MLIILCYAVCAHHWTKYNTTDENVAKVEKLVVSQNSKTPALSRNTTSGKLPPRLITFLGRRVFLFVNLLCLLRAVVVLLIPHSLVLCLWRKQSRPLVSRLGGRLPAVMMNQRNLLAAPCGPPQRSLLL